MDLSGSSCHIVPNVARLSPMLVTNRPRNPSSPVHTGAVVRPAAENVRRSKELLPKHQPGDLVRQGHRAQGQFHRCPRREFTVDPEIASDDEIETRRRSFLVVIQETSKVLTRHSLTGFVENDQRPPGSSERSSTLASSRRALRGSSERPPETGLSTRSSAGQRCWTRRRYVSTCSSKPPTPRRPNHTTRVFTYRRAESAGSSIPRAASSSLGASPQRLSSP